jgi:Flp pilus assembly CpaF family ATPase
MEIEARSKIASSFLSRLCTGSKGGLATLKAILRKGAIVPLEPLPAEWEDGAALDVVRADAPQIDIDVWAESMNELCADSSAEDEQAMLRAVEERRQKAKAQSRREMGLSA